MGNLHCNANLSSTPASLKPLKLYLKESHFAFYMELLSFSRFWTQDQHNPERVKNTSSEFHPAYFNRRSGAYFTSATVSSVKPARRLNLDESAVIHPQMRGDVSSARAFCWHSAVTAGHSRCKSSLRCLQRTLTCENGYF